MVKKASCIADLSVVSPFANKSNKTGRALSPSSFDKAAIALARSAPDLLFKDFCIGETTELLLLLAKNVIKSALASASAFFKPLTQSLIVDWFKNGEANFNAATRYSKFLSFAALTRLFV